MTSASSRPTLSLSSWLLLCLVLLLVGAAAAVWAMSRYDAAARFFGVAPGATATAVPQALAMPLPQASPLRPDPPVAEVQGLEARVARLENATAQVAGSAGRADALLIAFAARRAIDRGVALGYLEPLLLDRFGPTHRRAVATIVTGARSPVRLEQLRAEFELLERTLQGRGPSESLWTGMQREFGSLVSIRRADRPDPRPSASYERAKVRLASGQVDLALAEAMRLPGIGRAQPWVAQARTYIAVHRALDEIESAALLPSR
ncbi:MAG: hypothetical protein AVDCRST_MAG31-618 [uncultured Sphingomonas sp.]|uniref:Uncharacterized protein n=1 Tax=uncultured Sphingomonas sp. TaxID=158754 RepID=A0A6J4SRY9_9SPHN|nr:hypothetical protein [uncultured Sphingomonas sp.]CAA9503602.1 MAG: hypothetical protein AVDCRST_MAG31-618 [uncultured Sphingomonas sp.]